MSNTLFGTDGVRGVANKDLSCELAFRLGEAAVAFAGHKICIGRDTRKSGVMLESALVAGITSAGGTPHCAGIIPTPAIAYLTQELGCDAGIVISASHNPPEYNGIKFFSAKGMKLPDKAEDEIAAFALDPSAKFERPVGAGVGSIVKLKDAREKYIRHAIATIDGDLQGLKIAVDCGHGASCHTTPDALRKLGAEVVAINTDFNGTDINVKCGSTHLEPLRALMKETGADVGLAHDGDADRVLFVDKSGFEIDGDFVLAICASALKDRGELAQNKVISTVMCNLGFVLAMRKLGIEIEQTKVGDRYVLERMLQDGAILGGEQSGHVIFLKHNSTGDGLITALQLLSTLKHSKKSLEELRGLMTRFPQSLINVHCERKEDFDSSEVLKTAVSRAQEELADEGRVLVRASGTEPLVRVMVEAKTLEQAGSIASDLAELVKSELN